MNINYRKRKTSEDDLAQMEDDVTVAVNFIRKKPDYEPNTMVCGDISIPSCELFSKDKYKVFAHVLNNNMLISLKNADVEIRSFLSQLFFVIYKHQENSLNILFDIAESLDICVINESNMVTNESLLNWYDNCETKTNEDPFPQIYNVVTDIIKRVYALNFPGNVTFTSLDAPFYSTTFDTFAVRVSFKSIIAQFALDTVKHQTTKQTYTTRKMKSQKFVDELSRFIDHDGTNIAELVWRDADIGVNRAEDDESRDVVVHQQMAPFEVTKSENYAVIKDVLIYKQKKKINSATSSTGSASNKTRFNMRAYTKKTVTFIYDAKLADEYKEFTKLRPLN